MWWKNAKLWVTVLTELVSVALLVLGAAGIAEPTINLISTIAGMVVQLIAVILGAIWGAGVGEARAVKRF